MANKNYISDELLAAYLEGDVNEKEMAQVLQAAETDAELREALHIALQLDEAELPLQMAAEGGRNLCEVQCEAYVLKRCGIDCSVEELLELSKENHWIKRAGTPLQYMGNLLEHKGLKVNRKYEATIEDISGSLERGDNVIVAVDSDKLYPERPDEEDATNHAIVVIGIDSSNVTIYDPGDYAEVDIKMSLFLYAWKESHCYMVCATAATE